MENKANHKALEVLYKKPHTHYAKNILQKFFRYVWFNLHNSKAIRNRLKIVKREIKNTIFKIDKASDDISILSIASGSARAIFEALQQVDLEKNKVKVLFLDKNPEALEYSQGLRKELLPTFTSAKWVEDTASNFKNYFEKPNSIDLIEMVGLLDYFDEEKIVTLLSSLYEYLSEGGTLITANVTPNKEEPFITKVIDWQMIYKTPEKFIELAERAGFKKENIKAIYEPIKIHIILVMKK